MSGAPSPPPLFDSFNVASKACLTGGYEYQKLVDVVVRKNKILQDATSSSVEFDFSAMRIIMAVGLVLNKQEKISVLDFGGGGGYHWFIAKNSFGKNTIFDWRIVETSMMAKVSTELLAKDGLEFFSDIKSSLKTGETLDLVFTSSALQYCEEPLKVLQNLVNLNARHLFITRTPLSLSLSLYFFLSQSPSLCLSFFLSLSLSFFVFYSLSLSLSLSVFFSFSLFL